jgi:hypothetical protein
MRRLHVDQAVTLSLDEEPRSISCRVLDVQGSVGRLAHSGELPARAVGRLVLGWPGYLIFDEFGMAIGLRVAVRASASFLDVAVTDGIAMPERRRGERVRLVTRTRIISRDADDDERPPAWTETIDLSEHGALLRHHSAFDRDQRFALELMFGDDPQPITANAELARRSVDAVGVTFESIPADDATRLREYLTGLRHRRSWPAPAVQRWG